MCRPSAEMKASNGMRSVSCQRRIMAKRSNRQTCSALAAVAISDTMPSTFGLAITFGAYCGSISTTSAPVAFSRASPPCSSVACGSTALSRSSELVPACHSTRSGFSASTSRSRRASISAASSPFTPRLMTVMSWTGSRQASSSARRLGYDAAALLAPAPKVEDEPSATILTGLPAARSRAVRASGLSKRALSAATLQSGARAAAPGDAGAGNAAGVATGVCACADVSINEKAAATAKRAAARRLRIRRCMLLSRSLSNSFGLLPSPVVVDGFEARRFDDQRRDAAADAVVHAMRQHVVLAGGIKIECAGFGPVPHDGQPVEQRHLALARDHAHAVDIRTKRDHGLGARAVLLVHQDYVRPAFTETVHSIFERSPEMIGVDSPHRVDGTRLPYHQIGLLVTKQFGHSLRQVVGRLAGPHQGHDLHRNPGQTLPQGRFQARRIGRTGAFRSGQDR